MTTTDSVQRTPAASWEELLAGNERFVRGEAAHPRQDVARRTELAAGQAPRAAVFGCSDSRASVELLFDQGLGDLFVVRNAGQVVSTQVIGSLEYAVGVLGAPLVVVLAHDRCGAVQAAIDSRAPDAAALPPHIHSMIEPIGASVARAQQVDASADAAAVGREHLRASVAALLEQSELLSGAVAEGRLAIVGATYRLAEGRAEPEVIIGTV